MKENRALEPGVVVNYMRVDDARSSARSEEVIGAARVYACDEDEDVVDYARVLRRSSEGAICVC